MMFLGGIITKLSIPGAALASRPLENVEVALQCCESGCHLIPRAALLLQKLQDIQMSFSAHFPANCVFVPGAAILSEPLEQVQVASTRCLGTRFFIPRAILLHEPAQDLQLSFTGSDTTRLFVPLATVLPQPLQDLQRPALCGPRANGRIPRTPFLHEPSQRLEVAVLGRSTTSGFVEGAAVALEPAQHLQASLARRFRHCGVAPRAPLVDEPLENVNVSFLCSKSASVLVPRKPLGSQPLQDPQVSGPRSAGQNPLVPDARRIPAHPFQHLDLPSLCCRTARPGVERTALVSQPLHHVDVPVERREVQDVVLALKVSLVFPNHRVGPLEPPATQRPLLVGPEDFIRGVTDSEVHPVSWLAAVDSQSRPELQVVGFQRLLYRPELLAHEREGKHVVGMQVHRRIPPHKLRQRHWPGSTLPLPLPLHSHSHPFLGSACRRRNNARRRHAKQ
mmetsp:Transcript_4390/g.7600  ORF Transcript_4390/g.7600 Transcript_4390/m.7600 type:complete len:450 (+) Transcript_4390:2177-3526(+)